MQNGTNIVLESRSDIFYRGDVGTPAITSQPQTVHFKRVTAASRSGKRKKPTTLMPKYGTSSRMNVYSWTMLQKGIHGYANSWKPYGRNRFREFSPNEIENQQAAAERGRIISLTELSPLIQNKIREEIMSGKAQLAVDLVELRKTKSMIADAGAGLWHAYRDLRAGRPFATFVREMRRDGYRSYAGKKWLEYIYGWAPTISGAFEAAEVLSQDLRAGAIVLGKVRARQERRLSQNITYGNEDTYCKVSAKGLYQFTISDPKLLQLSQLGLTNPLSVAWELTPWSFVLDWFVDVGGYVNRMDYALGISDIWWQYSCFRKSRSYVIYDRTPVLNLNNRKSIVICTTRSHQRDAPSRVLLNSFRGIKAFTNETVRLTSAVALINQQLDRIKRIR